MGQSTAEVRHDIERTRQEMTGTIGAIADRVSPNKTWERQKQRVVERMRSMRRHVMGEAEHVAHTAEEAMHGARRHGEHVAQEAREAPAQIGREVRHEVQGNPIAAGVIAFGTGLLAAYLFPPSSAERRVAMQAHREAKPAVDEVKQAGRQVGEEVKTSAEEAARSAKETVGESARHVVDEAKGSAEQVRDQATSGAERVGERLRHGTS